MEFKFTAGTYKFHNEPNFNYQMNRWMAFGNIPKEDIAGVARNIKTLGDWKREFLLLADKYNSTGEKLREACACRAADFFMPCDDPEKPELYDKLAGLFRECYKEYFDNKVIEEYRVRYESSSIPVWRVKHNNGVSKGAVVMTGGFDCYKEELIPAILFFADKGFNTYYFEGPGQGEALLKSKLPMTHEWERPVKAVLDRFGLEDVTLIGLSLGGYLAPRAAVYDSRIKRVIAWGAMYDFYRVVSTRRGVVLAAFIDVFMALRLAPVINLCVKFMMKVDAYIFWGVDHGMHVMGVSTPYRYFRALKKFSMRKISPKVTQDFFLLAGAEDHFCELKTYHKQAKKLVNARSFTGRIFTSAEHAENHCQFGNLKLALMTMAGWIESMIKSEKVR